MFGQFVAHFAGLAHVLLLELSQTFLCTDFPQTLAEAAWRRHFLPLLFLGVWASLGTQYRTTNFIVNAPTPQIAQQVGQLAEQYRRDKAIQWLNREMPPWPQPCPLYVQVSMEPPSGATSFQFGQGQVMSMKMEIQGPLDRLWPAYCRMRSHIRSSPITFASPCRAGPTKAAPCSAKMTRSAIATTSSRGSILNQGRQIPLRRLLSLKEYPREVMCLYAQGYSLSDYLVKRSNRQTFLSFVGVGMQSGWDVAAQSFYGLSSVEKLEEAWLDHLYKTKQQPSTILAKDDSKTRGTTTGRNIVRTTSPPVQPLDPMPVARGAMPNTDQVGQRFETPAQTHGSTWLPVYPVPANLPPAACAKPEYRTRAAWRAPVCSCA